MSEYTKILEILEKQNKKIDEILKKISSTQKENKIKPQKKIVKTKKESVFSLIENLKQENFFDTPRSLKEIQKELQKLNYHYEVTSLTNPLQRLVRQRVLGRILEKGKWAYVKR